MSKIQVLKLKPNKWRAINNNNKRNLKENVLNAHVKKSINKKKLIQLKN